jgi:hypothetical protein
MTNQPSAPLSDRCAFIAELLNRRWVTQRGADDSARPAFIVEIPARDLDATIKILREACEALAAEAKP